MAEIATTGADGSHEAIGGTHPAPGSMEGRGPGLIARVVGVLMSPRETYAAVAARPRWLSVLALVLLVISGAQLAFLSTESGREMAVAQVLDQQVRMLESSGRPVSDAMYDQMEAQLSRFLSLGVVANLLFLPLILAAVAGLLTGVFGTLLGGSGTFRQMYAIMAHSTVILAVQALFSTTLSYAQDRVAGAHLGLFFPMLDPGSFAALLLGGLDLFLIWATISVAIGVGVLYKRRTGPVATGLLAFYVIVALVLAFIRS
jgi:hypothetical protein